MQASSVTYWNDRESGFLTYELPDGPTGPEVTELNGVWIRIIEGNNRKMMEILYA